MSTKQTAEQAADLAIKDLPCKDDNDLLYNSGYRRGFKNGSAWQREQGIDWISVTSPPDVYWEETEDGGSMRISKPILLGAEGKRPAIGQYWHPIHGNSYYRLDTGTFTPTHWAYITLPKTDK